MAIRGGHLGARSIARAVTAILALTGAWGGSDIRAGELSGRISTELYTYERADSSHVRPYVRFFADWAAWRASRGRSLTLHTSLRWTTDFSSKLPSDPQTYVYDTYARLANVPPGTDLYLGRQFVYSGIGNALLDGARVRYEHRLLLLDIYGGSRVSELEPERVRPVGDYGAWGGQLLLKPGRSWRLGIHLQGYLDQGWLAQHRIGASGQFSTAAWTVFGIYAYDLVNRASASFLGRIVYSRKGWTLDGEYSRRQPTAPVNTLFSLIDSEPYDQARVTAQRRVWKLLSVLVGLDGTFFEQESTVRARLGFSSPFYSLIGLVQSGDRGDLIGFQGHVSPYPQARWQPFLRLSFNRYAVQEEQDGRSDAHVLAAGTLWRGPSARSFRLELQYLRNALEDGSFRLFAQFTQGFAWKPGASARTP